MQLREIALTRGSFLPHARLPAAPDGAETALRSTGRQATILIRVHDATCRDCRRYLSEVAGSKIDLVWWEGHVIVIVPAPLASAAALRIDLELPFTVLSDANRDRPLGQSAGVVVADRFGQIYYVYEEEGEHNFPAPNELEEWLKFLATQCPE